VHHSPHEASAFQDAHIPASLSLTCSLVQCCFSVRSRVIRVFLVLPLLMSSPLTGTILLPSTFLLFRLVRVLAVPEITHRAPPPPDHFRSPPYNVLRLSFVTLYPFPPPSVTFFRVIKGLKEPENSETKHSFTLPACLPPILLPLLLFLPDNDILTYSAWGILDLFSILPSPQSPLIVLGEGVFLLFLHLQTSSLYLSSTLP